MIQEWWTFNPAPWKTSVCATGVNTSYANLMFIENDTSTHRHKRKEATRTATRTTDEQTAMMGRDGKVALLKWAPIGPPSNWQ
ncbi:hypothetical protein TNCV_2766691 [Trichonephila clavipes]|nr:hypothetical protein TNCV_2766691 [Trichonephila clavipes]